MDTIQSEKYILTCILNNPDLLWEVATVLSPKDFQLDIHKWLFILSKGIVETDKDLDESTLLNALSEETKTLVEKTIPDGDILGYIKSLKEAPHSEKNLEDNINAVKYNSVQRQLKQTFASLSQDIETQNFSSIPQLVTYCEDKIVDLGIRNETIIETHQIAEGLRDLLEERAKHPVEVPGLRTGFERLDKTIGGLMAGQLVVVAARPKVGKSTFLMNMAKCIAIDQATPVLMLDTEMQTSEVNTRMVAMLSGVEEKKLINGLYAKDDVEKQKVMEAIDVLETAPLYHIYLPEWDFDTILAYARKYKVRYNIGALFFDYIKLPDKVSLNASNQEYQCLGKLTTDLKNRVAGKLGIPVITAAQMNRLAVGADSIDTNQIAGSDRILHYANHLLTLSKKSPEEMESCNMKANLNLYLLASRSAESGAKLDILFKKPKLQMFEIGFSEEQNTDILSPNYEENWDEY